MNTRALCFATVVAAVFVGDYSYADEVDAKANAFAKHYADICLRNLPDLEALRARLIANNIPKFPPEQAGLFLRGSEGDIWPVPSQAHQGNFVMALRSGKNFCAIYGRRASQNDVEKLFVQLVGKAPPPFVSERMEDKTVEAGANRVRGHVISYTWSMPNAKRKFLFMLSTSDSEDADIQALASASTIAEQF